MVQVKRRTAVLTIGELAAASGVPTSTIRFWERRDLIRPTTRSGGRRRYDDEVLHEVGVLRLCQDAGFTLAEIHEMKQCASAEPNGWRKFVEAKIVDVAESLARLQKAHEILSHALECRADDITLCPKFRTAVLRRSGRATATDRRELAG